MSEFEFSTLHDFECLLARDPDSIVNHFTEEECQAAFAARKFIDGKLAARRLEAARAVRIKGHFSVEFKQEAAA